MSSDKTKFIVGVVLLIVAIIIIFSFIGGSSAELTSAADSITDANNCSEGTDLVYNISDKYCYNSTGTNQIYEAGQYDLPLNTLFSSTGVVLLVLMAAFLIFVVVLVLKFGKKQ